MNSTSILKFLMKRYNDIFVRDLYQENEDLHEEVEKLQISLNTALKEVEESELNQVSMGKKIMEMKKIKSEIMKLFDASVI